MSTQPISIVSRRIKQGKAISKEPLFARISDEAYLYANDEAERRGVSLAKAVDQILTEHKKRRFAAAVKNPIAKVVPSDRVQ